MSPDGVARARAGYLLALPIVAIASVLVGISLGPASTGPTANPGAEASDVAAASAPPTPRPSPLRPPGPNEYPDRCVLPEVLPPAAPAVAAPVVDANGVSLLFGSYLYERTSNGTVAALDSGFSTAAFGLWFAPEGSDTARLLLANEDGAVTPLAVSPDGSTALVWWLPLRGDGGSDDCTGGVYLLGLGTGDSRLLLTGDWSPQGPESGLDQVVVPYDVVGREYAVPGALFSRDGRFVALAGNATITIYRVANGRQLASHVGACDSWAWSSAPPTFAAGCEGMTSAWVAEPRSGRTWSVALPSPVGDPVAAQELPGLGRIGFTPRGNVRVVRFYAYPPGCDGGCQPPPPQYAATTIDIRTMLARSTVARTEFYAGDHAWLAPDATWVYAEGYPWDAGAHVIHLGSGRVVDVRRLGRLVGDSLPGGRLFGLRSDDGSSRVRVMALSATGPTTEVGSIDWADGAELSRGGEIPVLGLVVAAPSN